MFNAGRWRTSPTIRTTTCGARHRQRPRPKDSALRGLYQKPHLPIRVLTGTVLMNRWAGWCQRGQWFPTGHLTQPGTASPLPTTTSPRIQTTRLGQSGHDRREILHVYRTRHSRSACLLVFAIQNACIDARNQQLTATPALVVQVRPASPCLFRGQAMDWHPRPPTVRKTRLTTV